MGMLAIANADTKLIQHLKSGGNLDDPKALDLIGTIVRNTLANDEIARLASAQGLTQDGLCMLYKEGTRSILPNPVIQHGKTIIATSLIFQDFDRFGEFLLMITAGGALNAERDMPEITYWFIELVQNLKDTADASGKGASLQHASSGCAGVLLIAISTAFLASIMK
jgi:hypothetical protein